MYDHIVLTYIIIMCMMAVAWEMNWKASLIAAILVSISMYGNSYRLDWYNLYLIAWAMIGLSFVFSRYFLIALVAIGIGRRY